MRSATARTALAALAVGAAFVVAGCGGDDETTSSTTSGVSGATGVSGASLSHEAFITQADAICVAGDKTIETAAQSLGSSPTDAVLEQAVTDTVIPSLQQQHDAIAALGAPEGDEAQVEDLLTNLQDGIDALEDDPDLVTAGNSPDSPFAPARQSAQDLGLKECGAGD